MQDLFKLIIRTPENETFIAYLTREGYRLPFENFTMREEEDNLDELYANNIADYELDAEGVSNNLDITLSDNLFYKTDRELEDTEEDFMGSPSTDYIMKVFPVIRGLVDYDDLSISYEGDNLEGILGEFEGDFYVSRLDAEDFNTKSLNLQSLPQGTYYLTNMYGD